MKTITLRDADQGFTRWVREVEAAGEEFVITRNGVPWRGWRRSAGGGCTTAAESGCTAILPEDMADVATLLGVRIVNPFDGERLAPQAAALLAGVSL